MYGYKNLIKPDSTVFDITSWHYRDKDGNEGFEKGTISITDINRYDHIQSFILNTPYNNLVGLYQKLNPYSMEYHNEDKNT